MSLKEIVELKSWLGKPRRSPRQINKLNTSDCEILRLEKNKALALTTDSIADEISFGLYRDPETWGYMCATASLSDLSAVGAKPLGLLLSSQWSPRLSVAEKKKVMKGFHLALKKAHSFLLGGDSGFGVDTVLTSTGVGEITGPKVISRQGLREGDVLVAVGSFGLGPALGFRYLLGLEENLLPEKDFRPRALIKEGQLLTKYAHAMMDTSDGVMSTLFSLMEINGVSLKLNPDLRMLHPKAKAFCQFAKIPMMTLLFGEHGDYQLVAALRAEQWKKLQKTSLKAFYLGEVVSRRRPIELLNSQQQWIKLHLRDIDEARKSTMEEIHALFENVVSFLKKNQLP